MLSRMILFIPTQQWASDIWLLFYDMVIVVLVGFYDVFIHWGWSDSLIHWMWGGKKRWTVKGLWGIWFLL